MKRKRKDERECKKTEKEKTIKWITYSKLDHSENKTFKGAIEHWNEK